MIKVNFEKRYDSPKSKLELYTSITRIPFLLTIGEITSFPETIYCNNMDGENFIEFRFDAQSNALFEITLVTFSRDVVKRMTEVVRMNLRRSDFFICKILREEGKLEDSVSMKIIRTEKSLCLVLNDASFPSIRYFQVALNCYLGVDEDMNLTSILLLDITNDEINQILGFD